MRAQILKALLVGVGAVTALSAAPPATQTFTGTITDDMCIRNHASMRMGPTDAECTTLCVSAHGALFVLDDGKTAYALSNQKMPERLAGQRVRVAGTLDTKTKTIQVESIVAAQ